MQIAVGVKQRLREEFYSAPTYQISAKSDNPRLSSSDLATSSLGAVPLLYLTGSSFNHSATSTWATHVMAENQGSKHRPWTSTITS